MTGAPISTTSPFEYPVEESDESHREVQGTGDDWDAPPLPPRTQVRRKAIYGCCRVSRFILVLFAGYKYHLIL